MKGLILKDLYAMGSMYRNTLFSMTIVCLCFGLSLGAEGVAAATAIMCATMIVTTFALDERCGWPGFAAALPVSRKESVLVKYAVHVIYCLVGTTLGFVFSIIVNIFGKNKLGFGELGGLHYCVFWNKHVVRVCYYPHYVQVRCRKGTLYHDGSNCAAYNSSLFSG